MWQSDPKELSTTIFSRRAFIVLIGKGLIVGGDINSLAYITNF